MIFVHGGMSYEMFGFIGGGIVFFFAILFCIHLLARKTNYYREDFRKMTLPGKVIVYCLFLTVSAFLSSVITLIAAIVIKNIFP
jgi:hypothetical protein